VLAQEYVFIVDVHEQSRQLATNGHRTTNEQINNSMPHDRYIRWLVGDINVKKLTSLNLVLGTTIMTHVKPQI
jgi:hypothetical protein